MNYFFLTLHPFLLVRILLSAVIGLALNGCFPCIKALVANFRVLFFWFANVHVQMLYNRVSSSLFLRRFALLSKLGKMPANIYSLTGNSFLICILLMISICLYSECSWRKNNIWVAFELEKNSIAQKLQVSQCFSHLLTFRHSSVRLCAC